MKTKPKKTIKERSGNTKSRRFLHLIRSYAKKIDEDRVSVYSAQAAFYAVVSFVPILLLMLTILKYTPLTEEMIMETLSVFLNENIMDLVSGIVSSVYHGSVTLVSFAALSLFWVCGKVILGMTNGLNSIHRVRENRSYLATRIRSSFYALLMVLAFILLFGILVFERRLQSFVSRLFPFISLDNRLEAFVLLMIALVLLTLIFCEFYVMLPNWKSRFRDNLFGAVFTTVSWAVFTLAYSVYLTVAKNLSVLYGGLLTLMVSMLWVYFCMFLFFFGAELNAWIENPDSFPF